MLPPKMKKYTQVVYTIFTEISQEIPQQFNIWLIQLATVQSQLKCNISKISKSEYPIIPYIVLLY